MATAGQLADPPNTSSWPNRAGLMLSEQFADGQGTAAGGVTPMGACPGFVLDKTIQLEDGHPIVAASIRRLCGLDRTQSQAITAAWAEIFDAYRTVLAAHPPQVTAVGSKGARLRFANLRPCMAPLHVRAAHALDPLVANGTLRADQAEFLNLNVLDDLTFQWGERLEEIVIVLGTYYWSYWANTGTSCGQGGTEAVAVSGEITHTGGSRTSLDGSSASGSGTSLPDEYRALLSFVPFAGKSLLPPIPTPEGGK